MDSPLKDWGTLDPVAIDRGLADLNLSLDKTTKLSYARVADTHSSPLARPLDSTQARESVDPDVPSPQIVNGFDAENFCPEQRYKGHGYLDIIDFRDIPQFNSKEKRPPYRYATLIAMAILRANNHCLSLAQIYQWISDNFPYYSLTESGWQNSIRHNLSLNKNFIKIKRPSHDLGKGHF